MSASTYAPEAHLSPAQRLELGPKVADLDTSQWPMELDTERYWSDEFAELERVHLWPRTWQVACHESEVPQPGYWFEYTLLDQSYLIVRGNDNKIRAFINACRHRGNALCEGHGHSARLTCPFHLWQFELDGRLRKISDEEEEFASRDKSNLGLIPVRASFSGGSSSSIRILMHRPSTTIWATRSRLCSRPTERKS
ncbi:Rieske (2Fe-2S) protein [Mycobacterium sp. 94-17]|uniref:aromatic ring-hydroxylating oxygenase subunit alpha n=1 Tax=Mycobacterium sp. 94-17 TaxID=2986147 RepID=UPI002D1EEBE2|nr:Rieske (2Fe-2S) protein [Mycobacterium sp. 94-17]MEB4211120.1 Rieske (2Fe-2S) protein [Mycobacterium sp. 94-17]